MKVWKRLLKYGGLLGTLLLMTSCAWADSNSIGNTPAILLQNINYLGGIFQSISILFGVGLIVGALYRLKRYGEQSSMMSQRSVMGPLMMLFAGVGFVSITTFVGSALLTFWGNSSPLADNLAGSQEGWAQYAPDIFAFVRLVGVGSIMRSLFLAARSGEQAQQGTIGKVLTFLFAGILCVNVVGTMYLIENFFGFSISY